MNDKVPCPSFREQKEIRMQGKTAAHYPAAMADAHLLSREDYNFSAWQEYYSATYGVPASNALLCKDHDSIAKLMDIHATVEEWRKWCSSRSSTFAAKRFDYVSIIQRVKDLIGMISREPEKVWEPNTKEYEELLKLDKIKCQIREVLDSWRRIVLEATTSDSIR